MLLREYFTAEQEQILEILFDKKHKNVQVRDNMQSAFHIQLLL